VVEFRILGPVQAVRAGRDLGLGGPKQRAVLALLLLDAGRTVPAGHLIEALWRGSPPPGAAGTLRSYVSRLRVLLRPDAVLAARGGGYAISVLPDQLDASRFERLAGAGREALGRGEAVVAASRFREALGLWRGRALADVADVETLALEGARLEELRLVAVEGRVEADLGLGRHAEVTGELERLVAEHPVRERLWRLLVLALYRSERQAEALAAYRRARTMLAEELGLEPGEELRQLEQAVLRQEIPAVSAGGAQHNLPAQLTSFLGRERELADLRGLLGGARLLTLTGPGGAGKTRLALELATDLLERFPDGAWLAELAGIADPGLVPSLVMEALGMRPGGDVPVIEALRYRLRSARLLLILDNCEHLLDGCAELAGELLRSSPGLHVLTTSREPLGVPGEVAYPVPPLAVPEDLSDPAAIGDAPAVRLFLERCSSARAGGGPEVVPPAVVARICRELDGLPLAIELAAARTSTLSVQEIETHLADKFRFLAYRRPVADPRHQALKAAIGWSYELLSAADARVFRELSVFAGGFGLTAAAAVCGGGDAAAFDVIDRLASKSLVLAEVATGRTRYRLLETIRQYAAGRLAEAGEAGQARQRHALTFLGLAERESELAVLAREHDNFRAALSWSLSGGGETGPRLACALGSFWVARGFFQEARGWLERALACSQDRHLRVGLLWLLGAVLSETGDLERAEAILSEGSDVAAAQGRQALHARIRVLLAEIRLRRGGLTQDALTECEAAAATLESDGDLAGLAEALLSVGTQRFFLGDALVGEQLLERAAACARQGGNHRAEQAARGWLVVTFHVLPIPADIAIGRAERFLRAASGDVWAEALILQPLSLLYGFAGRFADARAANARSQAIFTRSGARFEQAASAILAGEIELIAGEYAAAEGVMKEGCEALLAMGERPYRSGAVVRLTEAVYAQGRLEEAQQLAEEAKALAAADDVDTRVRCCAIEAKLLARQGQFGAARRLADQAVALISESSYAGLLAQTLVASAEVSRLAGAPEEAEASLRRALRIYEDRRAVALAEQTRAALASLVGHSGAEPA
jgi:predicted ATPase/DNA-binding SARP family transcriptional activator